MQGPVRTASPATGLCRLATCRSAGHVGDPSRTPSFAVVVGQYRRPCRLRFSQNVGSITCARHFNRSGGRGSGPLPATKVSRARGYSGFAAIRARRRVACPPRCPSGASAIRSRAIWIDGPETPNSPEKWAAGFAIGNSFCLPAGLAPRPDRGASPASTAICHASARRLYDAPRVAPTPPRATGCPSAAAMARCPRGRARARADASSQARSGGARNRAGEQPSVIADD